MLYALMLGLVLLAAGCRVYCCSEAIEMAMSETTSEGRKMPKGFLKMWSLPKQADPELRRRLDAEIRDLEGDLEADPEGDPEGDLEDGPKGEDGR